MAKKVLALIVALYFTIGASPAHHGGSSTLSGPGLAGPIITIPARTMPKGKFFLGTGINYTNFNSFTGRELIRLDRRGEHFHDAEHIFVPTISGGYGLTDNLFLGISIPYVFRYDITTVAMGRAIEQGNSIGIGDITLFSEYRFLNNKKRDLHLALISGLKIPSGVRRERDSQGNRFEADDQPGTGSWDPIVGLALSKSFKKVSFDTNFTYKFSTEGTQDTIVGDSVLFNVALSHRVNGNKYLKKIFTDKLFGNKLNWDLILEANGSWSEKPEIRMDLPFGHQSFRESNHGGLLIYLTPGIRLTVNDKWISNFAISLPTIEDLNGRQRAPDAKLIFGFSRIF